MDGGVEHVVVVAGFVGLNIKPLADAAEESRSRRLAARMNQVKFLGQLGMTFFLVRLLVRDYLMPAIL